MMAFKLTSVLLTCSLIFTLTFWNFKLCSLLIIGFSQPNSGLLFKWTFPVAWTLSSHSEMYGRNKQFSASHTCFWLTAKFCNSRHFVTATTVISSLVPLLCHFAECCFNKMCDSHTRLKEIPRLSSLIWLWIINHPGFRQVAALLLTPSTDESFWIAVLCQDDEEDGEDADASKVDEDVSGGDPADGDTPASGETVDGPQMHNATFLEMLREATVFFFFFFKWETFANVLGCDEIRRWCATKELTLVSQLLSKI